MVAGAGDQAGAALAGIDHLEAKIETAEIDGRRQAGRAAAYHEAIENAIIHSVFSAGRRALVPFTVACGAV